jgi:hypothetical protein
VDAHRVGTAEDAVDDLLGSGPDAGWVHLDEPATIDGAVT